MTKQEREALVELLSAHMVLVRMDFRSRTSGRVSDRDLEIAVNHLQDCEDSFMELPMSFEDIFKNDN